MRTKRLALFCIALSLAGAACSKNSTSSSGLPSSTSPSASTQPLVASPFNDHGTKDASGGKELSVELDNFYFNPSIIKGTPGQKLSLELENESDTKHNFTLEEQKIDKDIEAGKKMIVSVTFPSSGTLQFFCEYHKAGGMKGVLSA